jgi:hypothetical protein
MKLKYYGVDRATGTLQFFGIDNNLYIGNYDKETSIWQLDAYNAALPVVYFANTYRILDSTINKIIYSFNNKNYLADLDLQKLGSTSSYEFSVNNVVETQLTSLPRSQSDDSAEEDLAKATSSPLIPILLIGAAYLIFFR